ncbi:MAG: hypothetical protein ACKO21_08000 [Nodosilinea sp.]|jgi:hypothetical protein
MTKKRLSDLLKEEVNKTDSSQSPDSPPDPGPAPEAVPASRRSLSRRRGSAAALQSATDATAAAGPDPSPETVTTPQPAQPAAESPASTIKAPDPRILELEAALATSETAKVALEKTVKGLQSDLEVQQARLFELKDSLDKSQAELREAKQTILSLSQVNTPAAAPAALPRASRSGGDIVPRPPASPPSQPGYVRGVPAQVPLGGQSNSMLSDADIGWVD